MCCMLQPDAVQHAFTIIGDHKGIASQLFPKHPNSAPQHKLWRNKAGKASVQHRQALQHPQAQRLQKDNICSTHSKLVPGQGQARTCGGSCWGHWEGQGAVRLHVGALGRLSMGGQGSRGLPVRHRSLPGGLPVWLP